MSGPVLTTNPPVEADIFRSNAAHNRALKDELWAKVAEAALGGAGYTKDWPVERLMRDSKLMEFGAGTNEIRRMLIGRELIGAA